jgi:hypothetical protein
LKYDAPYPPPLATIKEPIDELEPALPFALDDVCDAPPAPTVMV